MPFRRQRGWGRQKPPCGTPLNRGAIPYPVLGCWLLNEGAGKTLIDLAGIHNATFASFSTLLPTWSANLPFGTSPTMTNNGSDAGYINIPGLGNLGTCSVSFWTNETSANSFAYQFDAREGSGTGYCFCTISGLGLTPSAGTVYVNGTTSTSLVSGIMNHVVVAGVTINASTSFKLGIKNDLTVNQSHIGPSDFLLITAGTMTLKDAKRLYSDPFYMFATPRRRIISQGAAAGGGAPKFIAENFANHPLVPMGV